MLPRHGRGARSVARAEVTRNGDASTTPAHDRQRCRRCAGLGSRPAVPAQPAPRLGQMEQPTVYELALNARPRGRSASTSRSRCRCAPTGWSA